MAVTDNDPGSCLSELECLCITVLFWPDSDPSLNVLAICSTCAIQGVQVNFAVHFAILVLKSLKPLLVPPSN